LDIDYGYTKMDGRPNIKFCSVRVKLHSYKLSCDIIQNKWQSCT